MELVSIYQGVEISGVSISSLRRWTSYGYIPVYMQDGQMLYPVEYLRRLAYFVAGRRASRSQAQLCKLEWDDRYGDTSVRQRVRDEVRVLRENGQLLTQQETIQMLGYKFKKWTETGFLPAAKIDSKLLFDHFTVSIVKEVMDGFTSYEVAEQLGCVVRTVDRLAHEGKLKAVETPMGWRFDQAYIQAYIQSRQPLEGWLAISEVCQILKVSASTLEGWIERNVFDPVKIEGLRYIRAEDVMLIKVERDMLRGGFEGLEHIMPQSEDNYSKIHVAARLQLGVETIRIWTDAELLPYYDLSPQPLVRHMGRVYIAWYIEGLAHYAASNNQRPSKQLAQAYKEWVMQYYAQ